MNGLHFLTASSQNCLKMWQKNCPKSNIYIELPPWGGFGFGSSAAAAAADGAAEEEDFAALGCSVIGGGGGVGSACSAGGGDGCGD